MRKTSGHRGRIPKRLMGAEEIVLDCETSEAPIAHAHRQVGALAAGRADARHVGLRRESRRPPHFARRQAKAPVPIEPV